MLMLDCRMCKEQHTRLCWFLKCYVSGKICIIFFGKYVPRKYVYWFTHSWKAKIPCKSVGTLKFLWKNFFSFIFLVKKKIIISIPNKCCKQNSPLHCYIIWHLVTKMFFVPFFVYFSHRIIVVINANTI